MGLSNYLPSSRLIQPGVCTSSTRPASPFEGQAIYETDTDRMLVYTGSAWKYTWFATIPAFYVFRTTGQTISPSTELVFDSATVNNGSHYSTSTGRFTAPVAGLYFLETKVLTALDTNGMDIRFYKNGSLWNEYAGFSMVPGGGGNAHRQTIIQGIVSLAANDYVSVAAFGTIYTYGSSIYGHTSFTGYWVGN